MKQIDFLQHLAKITGDSSRRKIAEKAGIPPSTFVAMMAKVEEGERRISMDVLVSICRAYGAPLLPSVVAAGYITQREADNIINRVDVALSEISDEDLGLEVLRRLKSGESHAVFNEPQDENAKIVQLHREKTQGGITDHDDVDSDAQKVARNSGKPKLGDRSSTD